jgi:DeoR/GlpR family transcriptional regulator of sugar metabolism
MKKNKEKTTKTKTEQHMLAIERRKKIIELLNQQKSVMVPELSLLFGVTEETIRRDLEKLEQNGILVRTYGGATLVEESFHEAPVEERQSINYDGKERIGRKAAGLINDGDTIFLDASTSALQVAKSIKDRKGITVITNSEKVIIELSKSEGINVISTGGILRKKSMSYVGKIAEYNITNNYYARKAFVSCHGFTLNRGLTDSNEQEADIKKAVMNCCDEVIFLCDRSKFGKLGFSVLASLDEINCLVTDQAPEQEWTTELDRQSVQTIIA